MPELRQNSSPRRVIIATERAKRPEEMVKHRPVKEVAAFWVNLRVLPTGNWKGKLRRK